MGPHEQDARRRCKRVLKQIEAHLEQHPCGEKYFGKVAAKYPLAIEKLREGTIVGPVILDKLVSHMAVREKAKSASGGADQ